MERVYSASLADVWHAITDREAMKQWYFDTKGFRPEVGAEFSFSAGKEGMKCVHLCQVKEVIKNKKISYSWRYEGEEGNSLLTWELFDEGENTRLKLTHSGLETFTIHKKEDFVAGWTYFLDTALPKFVAPKPYQCRITVPATQNKTADGIADVRAWWSENFEGASRKVGDVFTVRFGETFVTFRVVEASDSRIAWLVTDCYKHWLKGNKQEWNGTTVVFELSAMGDKTQIDFTHLGLVPGIECYEGCQDGWNFYIKDSLFKLLTDGKGKPNTPSGARPLIVERSLHAPASLVWQALTEKDKMEQWFLEFAKLEPRVGFEFTFAAGKGDIKYIHVCRVTEVMVNKKLSFTWRYEGSALKVGEIFKIAFILVS